MKLFFLLAFLFHGFLAMASGGPSLVAENKNLRSAKALTVSLQDARIKASLKSGFHFNEKAPNSLQIGEQSFGPGQMTAQEIYFPNVKIDHKPLTMALYVCDDAVTFCETHYFHLKSEEKSSAAASGELKAGAAVGKINKHGFIENDFAQALKKAKEQKKLILVDFGARWCPGCVRLENEIFTQKKFRRISESFVKLKIDTDLFQNAVFSEKYHIYGIPTLMAVTADQKEISRIVDFQPMSVQEDFLAAVKAHPAALDDFMKSAANPDEKRLAGQRLVLAARYIEAVDLLQGLHPMPPELIYAQVEIARQNFEDNPGQRKEFLLTLLRAIKSEPGSSRSIAWRKDALEQAFDPDMKKELVKEGTEIADRLLADPVALKKAVATDLVGEFTNYEAFWVAILRADLIEAAGKEEESRKAWLLAGEIGEKLKISPQNKGPALRYLLILTEAKNYEKADSFSQSMLKYDPEDWDVLRRRLKILIELKKYKEAVAVGEKALKHSYDRNQYMVVENLAKAYFLAEQKAKAQALIKEFLTKPEASWKAVKGSKKKLEDLNAQIEAEAKLKK
jgi:thioredoxin-like negative regulator of GroEL